MGWLSNFRLEYDYIKEPGHPPRSLTQQDVSSFMPQAVSSPPRTREAIRANIRLTNLHRWRRMQRDLKWLEKQMIKRGLSPEDARWIL